MANKKTKNFSRILCLLLLSVISVSCVGIYHPTNSSASAIAQETKGVRDDAPQNLRELQAASDAQLNHWAAELDQFDGREYNIVTPTRNQGNSNICWAYATTGAVESNILRKGIDDNAGITTLDLDERLLAYARINRDGLHDPLYLTKDDVGLAGSWSLAGSGTQAYDTMTEGYALVDQVASLDEDDMDAMNCELMQSKYYIRNYFTVSNDTAAIKRAILKYGAVSFSYVAPSVGNSKYYSGKTNSNHESLIVGWDDTIDKQGFTPSRPTSNGAWIVKNSWGNYGNNEYNGISCFYMSYEEPFHHPYVVDVAMRENYQNIYHYDGQFSSSKTSINAEKQAAIYEAKLSTSSLQEQLTAVAIYTDLSDIDVKVEIRKNLETNPGDVNDDMNNPEQGPVVESKTEHIVVAGFHTIDLNQPVKLEQGEYFSIVVSSDDTDQSVVSNTSDNQNSVNDMTYYYENGKWQSYKYSDNYADTSNINCVAKIRAITNVTERDTDYGNNLAYARVEIESRLVPYEAGGKVIPVIEVYFGEALLRQDVDYEVKVENNDSLGMATLTIIGKGDYTGSRTTSFEVAKAKYVPSRISGTIKVYDDIETARQLQIPEGWDWIGGDEKLETGKRQGPFTLIYRGSDADHYQNPYSSFYIEKIAGDSPSQREISEANAEVLGSYVYTGEQIKPRMRITYLGVELLEHKDYELEFQNNTDAGEATVIVKGIGKFTGQSAQTFKIKKARWPAGKPKSTLPVNKTVKNLNEISLDSGWTWQKNLDIQSDKTQAIAVYNGTDKKNYGNIKAAVTIVRENETTRKNIASLSELTLDTDSFVYDGDEKKPAVIARDGEHDLIPNTDFEVEYQNNTNAGQASAIVTGLNHYAGSRTLTFNIARADRDGFKVILPGWTYGQTASEPRTEGQIETANVTYFYSVRRDGIYSTEKPTKAGDYWIKAVVEQSQNYNSAENIAQFTISKAENPPQMPQTLMTIGRKAKTLQDVQLDTKGWQWEEPYTEITGEVMTATAIYSDKENYKNYTLRITLAKEPRKDASLLSVDLDVKSFVYNGTERMPNVIAKDGDTALTPGVDYDVRYENNKFAGYGKAIVTFKNDYTGSAEIEFTIGKAAKPNVSDTTIRLDHKVATLADVPLPNDFVWKNGNVEITENRITAIAVYTGDDAGSFETTELTFEIIIEEEQTPTEEPKRDGLIWLAIGIPSAILIIGGMVGVAAAKRKRKK